MATTHNTPEASPATHASHRRVYVWELPVRIFHWTNALCIVTLCVTGFLIGAPIRAFYVAEAWQQYWFGAVRFTHFAAAFVFVFNFVFRIYWAFQGNCYANWRAFIPLRKWQRHEIFEVLRADILQVKLHGPLSTGHNSMAALTYTFLALAMTGQTITGFALYSSMSKAFLPKCFVWLVPLMGGEYWVRYFHHLFLWFFVLFMIVHIYLCFYHDYIEGRGTISSIVGGWKFEKEDDDSK